MRKRMDIETQEAKDKGDVIDIPFEWPDVESEE